jgi:hypothetical protein
MQSLPPNQENEIYFNVKLDDNLCAQVLRENRDGYRILSDMSLCTSEQEIQRQREEFEKQQQSRPRRTVRQPVLQIGCYIDKVTDEEVCVTAGAGECYFQTEPRGPITVDDCPDRVQDGSVCFTGRTPGTWECSHPDSAPDPAPGDPGICNFKVGDIITTGSCPAGVPDGYNCTPNKEDPEKWDCIAPSSGSGRD